MEIAIGSVLVISAEFGGFFRASQLSELAVSYFCLEPEKLGGVFTLREQIALKKAAGERNRSPQVLLPTNPISERLKRICAGQRGTEALARSQLLELFIGLFERELMKVPSERTNWVDGKERLRHLLSHTTAEELMDLSLPELARKLNCGARQLRRLFRQEVGASFREKQTELRMAKARELLASSEAKVVDVALISGYPSSSLFNLLFKKHYGLSPGQWRQQQCEKSNLQKSNRMLAA